MNILLETGDVVVSCHPVVGGYVVMAEHPGGAVRAKTVDAMLVEFARNPWLLLLYYAMDLVCPE